MIRLRVHGLVSAFLMYACALGNVAAASPDPGYHLAKTYKVGTSGDKEYYDYLSVDAAARRIYLSHGTEVLVMDIDSGTIKGKIPGFTRQHGVALATEFGKGFISDGDTGKVTIFDLKTLKKIGEVKAEPDADCIIYDPSSKRVFSMNGESKSVTAIDAKEGKVVGTIALDGRVEYAVPDGRGMVYVDIGDKNEVVALDSQKLKIESHWSVAPGGAPTSIDMDKTHRRLYIGGRKPQELVAMDADNGRVLQTLPISAGVDACVFDAKGSRLFVSTREGIVHIFHQDSPDKLTEVGQIKTEYGARTMAYDSKTQNIITDTADFTQATANAKATAVPGTFRVLVFAK